MTVIDAAFPFSVRGILKAAARIGKPITWIVLVTAHKLSELNPSLLAVGHDPRIGLDLPKLTQAATEIANTLGLEAVT